MSLKIKVHSKLNVTKNEMSLEIECNSKRNFTFKIECHLKWNVTQNRISLKKECHSKLNATQN